MRGGAKSPAQGREEKNIKQIIRINKMLGLNESSDFGLAPGEASVMRNWRVTADGRLALRPGTETVFELGGEPVRALWYGAVGGSAKLLAAAGGHIYDCTGSSAVSVGTVTDSAETHFFGFNEKVFVLTGSEYMAWDGTGSFASVEGYVPVVAVSTPPEGSGTAAEPVNVLTGKKRQLFSPDGTADTFYLAEKAIDEVCWVKLNGSTVNPRFISLPDGKVQLVSAPAEGINTLEICWRKGSGSRSSVLGMTRSETFNGVSDTRLFFYGDGTNRTVYSGVNYDGAADATYFPAMNFVDVDSANAPITSMVRHLDRLLVFKPDGMRALEYGTLTLADGSAVPGFPVIPVNREIGNAAPGFARLVDNDPITLHGRSLYRWRLSGAAVRDERTAELISAKAAATLGSFDPAEVRSLDNERTREFYVFTPDEALVYNYGRGAFYTYSGVAATAAVCADGTVYIGTEDGRLLRVSDGLRSDDGEPIDALWVSCSLSLGREWIKKYSTRLYAVLEPGSGSRALVSVKTDRGPALFRRVVSAATADFSHTDFQHFSFAVSRVPRTKAVRLRTSRFLGCKPVLRSASATAAPKVLELAVEFNCADKVI